MTPGLAAGLVPWTEPAPPAFSLPQLGKPAAPPTGLTSQSGDAILLHFFASWCEPCREELPALRRLSGRGAPRIKVVADCLDPDTFKYTITAKEQTAA